MTTAGIRRRSDYRDPRVGELARDADDAIRSLQTQLDALSAQLAELQANPPSGGSYTDEEAQDAVGGILVDTPSVNFDYDDATPEITATVPDMIGDSGAGGVAGLVPAPAAGDAAAGAVLHADATWQVPGAGSTVEVWMADARPASPHSLDEEGDSALTWLETDNGSYLTHGVENGRIKLTFTNDGSPPSRAFLTTPIPAGSEWAIACKVELSAIQSNYCSAGLALTGDLAANPTTAQVITWDLTMQAAQSGGYVSAVRWGSWNVPSTGLGTVIDAGALNTVYLRIRMNAGTLSLESSADGYAWIRGYSVASPFTIVRVGLAGEAQGGFGGFGYFDFVRFQEGAGTAAIDAITIGRMVSVGV